MHRTDSNSNTALAVRRARREEAGEIARLFLISSDGLASYVWTTVAARGESLEETGRRRYARSGTDFSFENCLLATCEGATAGMVHAFAQGARGAGDAEKDPVLEPYAALEDPGSLYIAGLAVYARYRGRGIGSALMDRAETLAKQRGLPRVSLICFERNALALEFYARRGYREIDRRAVVPHPSLRYADGDALLLIRDVSGGELSRPRIPGSKEEIGPK